MRLDDLTWAFVLAFVAMLVTAWGIGANDVANAFGTSVGSKALTLSKALLLASIFEFSGAFLLGSQVSETISKGLVEASIYDSLPRELLLGMLSALIATGTWLFVASKLSMPVSTTHSIVGGILGFVIAGPAGIDGIHIIKVIMIVISWGTSPCLAGLISLVLFLFVRRFILRSDNAVQRGFTFFPFVLSFTISVNVFFIIYKGAPGIDLASTPLWLGLVIALGIAIVTYFVGKYMVLPTIKKVYQLDDSSELVTASASVAPGSSSDVEASEISPIRRTNSEMFDPKVEKLFAVLQMMTACFVSFGHGANDVSNAVGPFAAVRAVYLYGLVPQVSTITWWILLLGGAGIVIGLATYGEKVMTTVGDDLTNITPTRGFSMELGTAFTVVLASKIGIPISTTHCLVGSVIGVGIADGASAVNWTLLGSIFLSWFITIPFTGIFSAALYSFMVDIGGTPV